MYINILLLVLALTLLSAIIGGITVVYENRLNKCSVVFNTTLRKLTLIKECNARVFAFSSCVLVVMLLLTLPY